MVSTFGIRAEKPAAEDESAGRLTEVSRLAGGGAGIRTQGPANRTAVFRTAAFNRSATPPTADHQLCEAIISWHHRHRPPIGQVLNYLTSPEYVTQLRDRTGRKEAPQEVADVHAIDFDHPRYLECRIVHGFMGLNEDPRRPAGTRGRLLFLRGDGLGGKSARVRVGGHPPAGHPG